MSSDLETPLPESRSQRRTSPLAVVSAVVVVAATAIGIAVWSNRGNEPDPSTAAPLDGAPTLQELAESAGGSPAGDDIAPDFSVVTADGGAFTLSRHLAEDGRPVILNLWASWCSPCRAEMPMIDAVAASHPEVLVIGVAVQDDPLGAAEFAEEIGVSYTIGFDDKDEVNDGYRPLGLPATFYISAEGIVVKRHFGGLTAELLEADIADLTGRG